MFVTKVTGTSGQRTVNNIYIASHSSHTNSAYQALTTYVPAGYTASSCYAETHILGGKYPVVQP